MPFLKQILRFLFESLRVVDELFGQADGQSVRSGAHAFNIVNRMNDVVDIGLQGGGRSIDNSPTGCLESFFYFFQAADALLAVDEEAG